MSLSCKCSWNIWKSVQRINSFNIPGLLLKNLVVDKIFPIYAYNKGLRRNWSKIHSGMRCQTCYSHRFYHCKRIETLKIFWQPLSPFFVWWATTQLTCNGCNEHNSLKCCSETLVIYIKCDVNLIESCFQGKHRNLGSTAFQAPFKFTIIISAKMTSGATVWTTVN